MQKIDREKFFFAVQGPMGMFNDDQKAGLNKLLDALEADEKITDLRWSGYILATTYHESAHTFHPIEEIGRGKGKKYGKICPKYGVAYYGRGLSQNTWYDIYKMLTTAWNKTHPDEQVNFLTHPELLCQFKYAYWAMSYGMRDGAYTGVGLPRYFNEDRDDPVNARKIINSLDCAEKIAGYHNIFLKALQEALV